MKIVHICSIVLLLAAGDAGISCQSTKAPPTGPRPMDATSVLATDAGSQTGEIMTDRPNDDIVVANLNGRDLTRVNLLGIEDAVRANREHSPACPMGMREIVGTYCTQLEHTCLKGRDKTFTYKDKSTGEEKTYTVANYFCDEFKPGSARCTGKEKPMRLCIDEYEFPNEPGEKPTIMTSWYDAHRLCKGQGKRLCDDQEWTLACEGPERKPYPYGWRRDPTACNIDRMSKRDPIKTDQILLGGSKEAREAELARLWDGLPIAASPRCKSDYGVYDMTGNVDEVTDNVTLGGKPYKDLWKGGHWVEGARNRCRPYTEGHNEGFGYYANGFRCCANPSLPSTK